MNPPTSAPAITVGALVGYIRVSTGQQDHDAQRAALDALGCIRVFGEKVGGQRADRPEYLSMLAYVRPGDVIVVTSLDRLSRSLSGIIRAIEELGARGIYIRTMRENIDTSTSVGRMLAGIFATLAQYERELIAERARFARTTAAANGRLPGRPRALSAAQVTDAVTLRSAGRTIPEIMATLGVKRATLYRALADHPVL